MFCYILGEAAADEFFIQDFHLNFHSFLGFQHGSGFSVKAIMLLLPLVIGLECFCILTKAFCQYILNLMSKKKLGSFNDLIINSYFQFFISLSWYRCEHFLASIFCKVFLALLNRVPPILERLNENIMKPWKPSIIDKCNKWC